MLPLRKKSYGEWKNDQRGRLSSLYPDQIMEQSNEENIERKKNVLFCFLVLKKKKKEKEREGGGGEEGGEGEREGGRGAGKRRRRRRRRRKKEEGGEDERRKRRRRKRKPKRYIQVNFPLFPFAILKGRSDSGQLSYSETAT